MTECESADADAVCTEQIAEFADVGTVIWSGDSLPEIRMEEIDFFELDISSYSEFSAADRDRISLYYAFDGDFRVHIEGESFINLPRDAILAFAKPKNHAIILMGKEFPYPQGADVSGINDLHVTAGKEIKGKLLVNRISSIANTFPDIIAPFFVFLPSDKGKVPGLRKMIEALIERGAFRDRSHDLICKKLTEAIVALITMYGLEHHGIHLENGKSWNHDRRLRRVLSAIHGNYAKNWDIDAMADLAAVSRSTLNKLFLDALDESPLRYLSKIRMNRAATLLRSSEMSLFQIANAVGYTSESSFCKSFRKIVGIPPGQYRRSTL
ncbi:AraC family transcriptional regulator [Sphingobium yanoikuyae]|uniref:AraC family transcriptional regulator n=1 Tax=Sphingobium yanoikuyae TaxID=13690 RepID=A0A084E1T7_SPHYA|nr:AraC family transcriptional regulator [Sphingobium yanoikuyae]KEZ11929.1 AraC family transcriptional regulator [Sphingobium yanoikuyae]